MNDKSRTAKSIINAQVALVFYILQLILSFWSRKVFFTYLGSEAVGLDSTVGNFLGFLNLAELGIGTSVGYFLYKPIANKEYDTISEVVSLQGWLYKRIGVAIMVASFVLMLFFPRIFSGINLPVWYPYAVFLVGLFGALVSYFVNYSQIVLNADQNTYKVTSIAQGFQVLTKISLILLLPRVSCVYELYLVFPFLGTLIGSFALYYIIRKEYPWLKDRIENGKELFNKYPEIFKKTKQAFAHQLGTVALNQVSPLIMFSYTSLSVIACYGNYMTIVNAIIRLFGAIFSSTSAAIGNLIASQNKENVLRVFWELFDSRFCISWTVILILYYSIDPFITLWLGQEYIMAPSILMLLLLSSSISLTRNVVDLFKSGYGLFSDVWSPVVETIINLSISIALGYRFGVQGVLCGVIISQIIVIGIWKPYFLFKRGFCISSIHYFVPIAFRYLIIGLDLLLINYFIDNLGVYSSDLGWLDFILGSLYLSLIISVFLFAEFYLISRGMRDFVKRMLAYVKR